jgi:hypothetical protein
LARSIEFSHASLTEQLNAGIRQLELDVYADPEGGRFARPVAPGILACGAGGPAQLTAPGFKVMHAPELDFLTTCWT